MHYVNQSSGVANTKMIQTKQYPKPQTEAFTGQICQEKTMLIERRVKGMKFYMKMNMVCQPTLSLKMSWASGTGRDS